MAPFADHRNFLCIVGGVLEVGLPRVCGECAEFEKVFSLGSESVTCGSVANANKIGLASQ